MAARGKNKKRPEAGGASAGDSASSEMKSEAKAAVAGAAVLPPEPPEAPPGAPVPQSEPEEGGLPWKILGLTALAAIMRFPFMLAYGLWLDEIYIHKLVKGPIGPILKTVHFMHLLPVKLCVSLADSQFTLRFPSFLFGVLAVPVGFLAIRRLFNSRIATLFALVLAIVPYFINYSIDANYYSDMIFWILAALYFYGCLFTSHQFRYLIPLALCGVICFFVHPFSALFFAALIVVISADLVITPAYFEKNRFYHILFSRSWERLLILPVSLLLLGLVVALVGGRGQMGKRVISVTSTFLGMLSLGKTPENVSLSYAYVVDFFRRIGPEFFHKSFLWFPTTYALFALFITGVIASYRRDRLFPMLLLLPFLLSFGLLFNLDARRNFEIRYFSFLVPIYWFGIVVGASFLRDRIERFIPGRGTAAVVGLIVLALMPDLTHMILKDGGNWNTVMPEVVRRVKPGEPFVYTNWAEEAIVPYYLNEYGLKDHNTIKLHYTSGRDKFTETELRSICYDTSSLWFASTWLDIYSMNALAWADKRMEKVASGPSAFSQTNDVTVYHWNWGGRYVSPPRILRYTPGPENRRPFTELRDEVLFELGMEYEFRIELAEKREPGEVKLAWDGGEVALAPLKWEDSGTTPTVIEERERAAKSKTLSGRAKLSDGPHQLLIGSGGTPIQLTELQIIPLYPNNEITLPAGEPNEVHPSLHVLTPERDGNYELALERKTYATYMFSLPNLTTCWVGLEAQHTQEEPVKPVLIEMSLNHVVAGVLEFPNGPPDWQIKGFPVMLGEGDFDLTVQFLNERDILDNNPTLDRDVRVKRIIVRPLAKDAEVTDDRLFAPTGEPEPIPLVDATSSRGAKGQLKIAEGWEFTAMEYEDLHQRVVGAGEDKPPIFEATFARGSKGMILSSPPKPMPASGLLYYSCAVRNENMQNFSANLRTLLLNKDKKPIAEIVVNQEGLTGDTPWVRLVEFRRCPPEAKYFEAMFWVYPNSQQPTSSLGKAYFTRLQMEATK